MKLATDLHLVPRSRMVKLYLHSPRCLLGVMICRNIFFVHFRRGQSERLAIETEIVEKNLIQFHFVHHKSHVT
jgi:hypothetical protein